MTSVRKFHAVAQSVPAARRFVREALRDQSRELIQAAELMTSELVTNCVQHARTDFELAVRTGDQIRVEVRDGNEHRPMVRFSKPEDQSGRGLRIVEAMSDAWGVLPSPRGKVVWFALELQPELQPAASDETQPAPAPTEQLADRGARADRRKSVPSDDRSAQRMRGGPRGRRDSPRGGRARRGPAGKPSN